MTLPDREMRNPVSTRDRSRIPRALSIYVLPAGMPRSGMVLYDDLSLREGDSKTKIASSLNQLTPG